MGGLGVRLGGMGGGPEMDAGRLGDQLGGMERDLGGMVGTRGPAGTHGLGTWGLDKGTGRPGDQLGWLERGWGPAVRWG